MSRQRFSSLVACLAAALLLAACGGGGEQDQVRIVPAGDAATAASGASAATNGSNGGQAEDKRVTVFIDAGHGGRDPGWGASYILRDAPEEKALTLDLAKRTAAYVEADGFRAVLSRTTDTDVNEPEQDINGDGVLDIVDELQARADLANAAGAAVLLSLHFNGLPGTQLGGSGTYYNTQREFAAENKRFAEIVQTAQLEALAGLGYKSRDWEALPEDAFATPTQAKIDTGYHFNTMIGPAGPNRTRPSMMPAAIAEPLFLTNQTEVNLATREDVRDALAKGYARAIRQFLQEKGLTASASRPAAAASAVPVVATTRPALAVDRGTTSQTVVALTFDAGAEAGYTAAMLDTLARMGVKASFGLTGRWCEKNPELARRITAEGHAIINHTYDHASWTGESPSSRPLTVEQRRQQVQRAETAIEKATGSSGKPFFRSPYGDRNAGVNKDLGAMGYRYNVLWTFDSRAWRGEKAESIISKGVKAASPGAIYVLHVNEQQDALALERLIEGIRGAGFGFVTVTQLFATQ